MTVQEFIEELEHWKKEAAGYKHQMEVNLDYCYCYESALTNIAKMCGWSPETKGGLTSPPQDIDGIAINAVQSFIDNHK